LPVEIRLVVPWVIDRTTVGYVEHVNGQYVATFHVRAYRLVLLDTFGHFMQVAALRHFLGDRRRWAQRADGSVVPVDGSRHA
jgi:hypothetical protein